MLILNFFCEFSFLHYFLNFYFLYFSFMNFGFCTYEFLFFHDYYHRLYGGITRGECPSVRVCCTSF